MVTFGHDLTGQVFGQLTVLYRNGSNKQGNCMWVCRCRCGAIRAVASNNLKSGNTKSCGCIKGEKKTTHGHAARTTRTAEYRSWHHAKGRCFDPNDKQYSDYGGRGVAMCQRWRDSFAAFIEDMGRKPDSGLSIDRIDNDGHYSCGHCEECKQNGWTMNCQWATAKQQANNRRKRRKRHRQVCEAQD